MPGATVTFNAPAGVSTVYVTFSASGTYGGTTTAGQFANFRPVVNGVNGRGTSASVGAADFDDIFGTESHNLWGASFTMPVTVNPGASNTIKIQWSFASLYTNTIACFPTTLPESSHRSLVISY